MRLHNEDLAKLCNNLAAELYLLQYTHSEEEKKLLVPKLDAVLMKLGKVLTARQWDEMGYAEIDIPSEEQAVIVIALDAYLLYSSRFHGRPELVRTMNQLRGLMGLFR